MDKTAITTKGKWKIDDAHTDIGFKVKHMMISKIRGVFGEFEGFVIAAEENFLNATFELVAKADSIHTNNDQRDAHLKSPDFFDVKTYPSIHFVSTSYNGNVLVGDLTIKGVTKSVGLKSNYNGIAKDNFDNIKAGFEFSGTINRKDFGLGWDALTETGKIVVSDSVGIEIDLQLIKEE